MAETKRIFTFLLRFIAFCTTLSASIVMASSRERTTVLALSFEAKYSDTPALMYFVIVNAIVSVYGFLILFLPSKSQLWRLVVALDAVFTMLLTSSISAAMAIAYVGKKGNPNAGWLPICDQVRKYCNQVQGALIVGFINVILYILFFLYSIHTTLNPLLLERS
ncbi:CASP-like protein 1C2 [Hibiscus syriacus]|uniref:CASP-like protein n=1 Tax=Hibiscus syriacus TaxID=106335 RepID=A0A6A2YC00_HIBSY|nr:CASP-like protein 1C1 [Hibiscus syriacus]KAE8670327.1 CASP-like protein 1C2 [Hibiscus syriacus]